MGAIPTARPWIRNVLGLLYADSRATTPSSLIPLSVGRRTALRPGFDL